MWQVEGLVRVSRSFARAIAGGFAEVPSAQPRVVAHRARWATSPAGAISSRERSSTAHRVRTAAKR